MSDKLNPRRPSRAPFDSQFEKEESRVRARREETPRPGSGSYEAVLLPSEERERTSESVADRTARIEHKVAKAMLVLEKLPPTDSRARLLSSAVLRRDEVLIDAVLGQMAHEVVGMVTTRRRY